MTVALLLVGVLGGLNLIGLAMSLVLDRKGLPTGLSGQAARRKPGTLQGRLPLIAFNLSILLGGAFVGLTLFGDRFTFEAPSLLLTVTCLAALMLVDDLWFYAVHRLLHENRWLYKKVHKVHHKAYAPVPIEYIYVHPAEWMAGALGPVAVIVGIIAVQGEMNAWIFLGWSAFRTLHELDIHSGVRSIAAAVLPLYAPMEHHDLHHAKPTLGNYASTFLTWDRLLRTEIKR